RSRSGSVPLERGPAARALERVGALLPERGVLDAQLPGVELGVEARLLLGAVVLERLEGRALQEQDADDVQPRHRADADVTQTPRRTRRRHGAVGDRDEHERLQRAPDAACDEAVL